MQKYRIFFKNSILCFTLALILTLSGCNTGENANMNPAVGGAPSEGGVLNLASYAPDTLNPLCTGYACMADYLYLVYESLFTVNEDLTVKGVLAEGYKVKDKNTVFSVTLKKGVKFHDGSSFTADDVVSTFDYLRTYPTNYSYSLRNVKSYSAKGNYEVEITLDAPQANFAANLDFPVLPSGLTSGDFNSDNSSFKPNGTGRYKYEKTNPYESVVFSKNSAWHGDTAVYIPKVCIRFVDGKDAIAYAFDSGETDMVTTDYGRWGEFSYTTKHNAYEITTTKYVFVGLNTRNSAFSDVELRRKLNGIIDKNDVVDSVMFSHAVKADNPITSKVHFYRSDKDKESKPETGKITEEKLSTYILYNEESKIKDNVAGYIKKLMEEAGVKVELTKVSYDSYIEKIKSGDYQIYIGEVDIKRDCDLRFMFNTAPVPVAAPAEGEEDTTEEETPYIPPVSGSTAICDYSHTELDNIINNINSAENEETKKVAYNNLSVYFEEKVPQIPLVHVNDAIFVSKRIAGKIEPNLTSFFADIGEIYIPEK